MATSFKQGQYVYVVARGTRGGENDHARITSGKATMRLRDGVGLAGRTPEPHYHVRFWHGGASWVPAIELRAVRPADLPFVKAYWHREAYRSRSR